MEIGPSGTSAEDSMEIAGTLKKTHKKFNKEDDLIRELSNSPRVFLIVSTLVFECLWFLLVFLDAIQNNNATSY